MSSLPINIAIEELMGTPYSGIMSGQSEADFELGYNVNVFSHLNVLSALAKHAESREKGEPLPVHVNVSSLAVYGGPKATPNSRVVPE
jgi:NAD(P)-dependent dehydrogenase (short-subunit alcohol dehydrogenase family)